MNILLAIMLAYGYSPSDSSWSMVSLREIPERAILFAELAARDGGRPVVDLGSMLELAGRFERAEAVYRLALNSAEDSNIRDWLTDRLMGTRPLDTLIILSVRVTNQGHRTAEAVRVEIPLPVSHPPYQHIVHLAGVFTPGATTMSCSLPELGQGCTVVLPLVIQVTQVPYTYRPLRNTWADGSGPIELAGLAGIIRSMEVTHADDGPGPCLELAFRLKEMAGVEGMELTVTGGLLRTAEDGLLFHAWNHLPQDGMPLDVSLFHADSLRGMAHCPTDMIPLWNLENTGGHEVSAFYSQPDADLSVSMTAAFADPELIITMFGMFPLFFLTAESEI